MLQEKKYNLTGIIPKAKLAKKLPTILDKKTFINLVNNENNIEHKLNYEVGLYAQLEKLGLDSGLIYITEKYGIQPEIHSVLNI